jgi:GH25 family lysozyme M1 (1,4-beta-N-acetylmuramidase)
MWQYSSTGRVDGINGNVDMNECYVDYPTQIKADGRNGFPKPEPVVKPEEPQLKTIDVEVVVDGIKYSGTLTEKK